MPDIIDVITRRLMGITILPCLYFIHFILLAHAADAARRGTAGRR